MAGPNTTVGDFEVTGNIRATSFVDGSATPGAATANTIRGRHAVANGAASIVITNNKVSAASQILWTSESASLGTVVSVIPTAGSFTLTVSVAVLADSKFSWTVIN